MMPPVLRTGGILLPKNALVREHPGSLAERVVLRAANQNYHDCRWQSYHNVLLAKIFDF